METINDETQCAQLQQLYRSTSSRLTITFRSVTRWKVYKKCYSKAVCSGAEVASVGLVTEAQTHPFRSADNI